MSILDRLSPARRLHRAVWSSPTRKRATLELFARTEADGGRDVASAARRTRDPWLRERFLRHASDEERHSNLFRERAAALEALEAGRAGAAGALERAFELDPSRADLDSHGFLRAGMYDELGEVAYVAMLHVAELRAAALFRLHRDLLDADRGTQAVFVSILRDEAYHDAYTGEALKRWRAAGRGREVKRALESARGARFLGALRRAGTRAANSLGRTLLLVLQVTLLLPAAWIARRHRPRGGWRPVDGPGARSATADVRAQS